MTTSQQQQEEEQLDQAKLELFIQHQIEQELEDQHDLKLFHQIKQEVLDYLEQDIRVNQCCYCNDNKPIKESSTREHTRRHHMKPGIDDFIQFKCVRH